MMDCSVKGRIDNSLSQQVNERGKAIVDGNIILDKKAFGLFNDDISRRLKAEHQVESDENVFIIKNVSSLSARPDVHGYFKTYEYTRWVLNFPLVDQLEYNRLNPPTSALEELGIKPGVPELFESNPELANAVYEALGFKTSIKQTDNENKSGRKIDFSQPIVFLNGVLIDGNNRLRAANQERKSLERIDLNSVDDIISNLPLLKKLKNGNIQSIVKSVEELLEPKEYIRKTIYTDAKGRKFDNIKDTKGSVTISYEKSSRTEEEFNKEKEGLFENILKFRLAYAMNNLDELEVINVTPQQKQQAQQLYSQYLDTIFPDSKVKDIVYRGGEGGISNEQYYTLQKNYAERYGKTIPVILNLPNPVISDRGIHRSWVKDELTNRGLVGKDYPGSTSDAVIEQMNGDVPFSAKGEFDVYVIKNNNQKLELGSKQDIEGFKQWNNKQQQVSELFESNLEIANAVYEATGFKNDNKNIVTVFHGSNYPVKFENFDTNKRTTFGIENSIRGIWFAKKELAEKFSDYINKVDYASNEQLVKLEEEYKKGIVANPFIYVGKNNPDNITKEFIDTYGLNGIVNMDINEELAYKIIKHEDFKREAKVGEIFQIDKNGNISLKDKTLKQIINEPNLYERKIDTTDFYQDYTYADLSNNGEVIYKILKKAKEQGYKGVVLNKVSEKGIDTPQYVVFDTSTILQNIQITPQQKQQAQQLYSQYLESLNKPNTNPVLQGNQQEQVKKFAELQERLNNKEFLEGAKNAYDSSKGLQEWGTQEQYNDYIARVSLGIIKNPSSGEYNYTSKVKDIVYRGGNITKEEFANSEHTPTDYMDLGIGLYLTPNIKFAENYGKPRATIVNIKNPKDVSVALKERQEYGLTEGNYGIPQLDSEGQYDGIVDLSKDFKTTYELVVFDSSQIHILGSKQDIQGFKEFVREEEAQEAQEEYLSEKQREQMPTDYYMGDEALRFQEREDRQEFRNQNSNMTDEDIDDYYNSCR